MVNDKTRERFISRLRSLSYVYVSSQLINTRNNYATSGRLLSSRNRFNKRDIRPSIL